MIALILAAQIAVAKPWNEQIMDNLKAAARNCFQIGADINDMKRHPEEWKPGAYEISREVAKRACFLDKTP